MLAGLRNSVATAAPPPLGEASVAPTSGSIGAFKLVTMKGTRLMARITPSTTAMGLYFTKNLLEHGKARAPEAHPKGSFANKVPQQEFRPGGLAEQRRPKTHQVGHLVPGQAVPTLDAI